MRGRAFVDDLKAASERAMNEINSSDYHDFVFRDGKLVGEFEQMYRKSKDVPWHQDREAERIDCRVALDIAQASHCVDAKIAEVGCGLGFFADLLSQRFPQAEVTGFDISDTAILKAGQFFPHIKFEVMDITGKTQSVDTYDLVCIRGCFWYLFHEIDLVAANLTELVQSRGHLLIAQNFPPLDKPYVGREAIPSPEALINRFLPAFDPIIDCRLDDKSSVGGNDNWVIFLGRKKV
ncbi:MAG: class I SAM-dependent methyltransferase [Verrucomicrobiae bacterium]